MARPLLLSWRRVAGSPSTQAGTPDRTRTCGLPVRNRLLYPLSYGRNYAAQDSRGRARHKISTGDSEAHSAPETEPTPSRVTGECCLDLPRGVPRTRGGTALDRGGLWPPEERAETTPIATTFSALGGTARASARSRNRWTPKGFRPRPDCDPGRGSQSGRPSDGWRPDRTLEEPRRV